jgi:hypothetical protein
MYIFLFFIFYFFFLKKKRKYLIYWFFYKKKLYERYLNFVIVYSNFLSMNNYMHFIVFFHRKKIFCIDINKRLY